MSNCKRKKKTSFGITLVETLFSAAIIALVIAGVLVIFVQTIDMSKRADYEYTATNLAKNRLEMARKTLVTHGFDFLDELDEDDTEINSDGGSDPDGNFRRTTSVTSYPASAPHENLQQIEVTVTYKYRGEWKEDAAIAMTVVLTDIIPDL